MKHKNAAYIDVGALEYNYHAVEQIVRENLDRFNKSSSCGLDGGCDSSAKIPQIIGVVKADAYGHGVGIAARRLYDAGCGFFAVSSEEEALELREIVGVEPEILILGRISPENVFDMAKNNIICAVTSYKNGSALAEAAESAGVVLRVHVSLDTGMNRIGIVVREFERNNSSAADEVEALSKLNGLSLCGIFTHFASADDELLDGKIVPGYENFGGYTRLQLKRFKSVVDELKRRGVDVGLVHAANSAAILALPEAYFDAVRAGVILYGLSPNGEDSKLFKPVMKLCSTVVHIHEVKAGERVSYGGTFEAGQDMVIATIAAGYADGFERSYTGCEVKIGGRPARQVGRICMDQFMADVTDNPGVKAGDECVLFEGNDVNQLARRAGTINYEVVCKVSKRVVRVPVE